MLIAALASVSAPSTVSAAVLSGSFEVTVTVKVDGVEVVITAKVTYGEATVNSESSEQTSGSESQTPAPTESESQQPSEDDTQTSSTRVSVHDPSIVKDGDTYYIFGSHMAWAKSTDLVNWTTFTNNINRDFRTIFAEPAAWSASGNDDYDVAGNLWAPDVIYNDTMKKWCMYMSVNGVSWNSSIVLLTADSLDGDWTYVGPVIYSGFSEAGYSNDFNRTDYVLATGETTLDSHYISGAHTYSYDVNGQTKQTAQSTWNHGYGAHAIDPCVLYDDDGKLYMSYGSWSGGIYMIELDETTGLRDYTVKYDYDSNRSDPYMGRKLAGGSGVSGEASYVQKIGDFYYLFVTYGGLTADGGYNMRVFRSESLNSDGTLSGKPAGITGPYVDQDGQSARYTSSSNKDVGSINGPVGERLMAYYKWSFMNSGYCAQGHNSVLVDEDGKIFIVYHTRFNNKGEMHEVRVHQAFVNEDGWLVTAPFEYRGETLSTDGYTAEQVAGTYEVLFQQQTGEVYKNKECVQGIDLTLDKDGIISGDKSGTWAWSDKGSPYVDMTIDGVTYNGVFLEQTMEETTEKVYTFTVLGSDEVNVWGYRKGAADDDSEEVSLPEAMYLYSFENASLDSTGTKTGLATIVGDGTVIEDTDSNSGRGMVFNNAAGQAAKVREDYLSLPVQVGSDISASANRAFTIAMWIKSPEGNVKDTNYNDVTPLFAMKKTIPLKDGTADACWPLVNVGLRGTSQVNWAGWIDNVTNADTAYIEDHQWHYVVATFSDTKTVVYIDGVMKNTATNTSANTCAGIFGAEEGTWGSVNVGGNQIWAWNDPDAHLYFDDIAIYDVELSQKQVKALYNK